MENRKQESEQEVAWEEKFFAYWTFFLFFLVLIVIAELGFYEYKSDELITNRKSSSMRTDL